MGSTLDLSCYSRDGTIVDFARLPVDVAWGRSSLNPTAVAASKVIVEPVHGGPKSIVGNCPPRHRPSRALHDRSCLDCRLRRLVRGHRRSVPGRQSAGGLACPPRMPNKEKLEVYECGEPAIGSSFVQFDLRFYVVALLFIIFDVEVALFFPWATVFGKATQLTGSGARERVRRMVRRSRPQLRACSVSWAFRAAGGARHRTDA